ncbi:MAG: FAD-binding protein [Dysgonamonadaceae bacterium]|jgi:uncharacterized FAD-dependent dehydrogenase|nr:FAD-binding protein [Dysgonamonadaceae bacterium]
MVKEFQYRLLPQVAALPESIKQMVAAEEGISADSIKAIRILKRSVDARQRTIYVNLKIRAFIDEFPGDEAFVPIQYRDVSHGKPVIIVGAGPAGLFAALRLIELKRKPILIERGKDIRERKKDIARIAREQQIDPESNYCFGEGGAGAYSDGKLYTRSKKRGAVEKILNVFCRHGADLSILYDAHPHIGTDKLPAIIGKIRETILQCGGEVHFETRMDALIIAGNEVCGVKTGRGVDFHGPVILATGHSARDVYHFLHDNNICLESKGLAIGLRLEHPQALIDQIRYHNTLRQRDACLPAAEYSMVTQVAGRGVYSFCMCPGGFVIPAASDVNQLLVNGMSPSNRGSRWANAGMVVEVHPEDFPEYAPFGPLALMKLQEKIEGDCFHNGNRQQTAPAQRMVDFVQGKCSVCLPDSSYAPGILASPLHFWMPGFVVGRLQEAFKVFGKQSKGFLTNEATLIGVETRTSSPVRICRDKDTLEHVTIKGLYPCGEGAGYAGGIVSAAIDGERCAEAAAIKQRPWQ